MTFIGHNTILITPSQVRQQEPHDKKYRIYNEVQIKVDTFAGYAHLDRRHHIFP